MTTKTDAQELLTQILATCATPNAESPIWDAVVLLRAFIDSVPAPLGVEAKEKLRQWLRQFYSHKLTQYDVDAILIELFSRVTRVEGECPECEKLGKFLFDHGIAAGTSEAVECAMRMLGESLAEPEVLTGPCELSAGIYRVDACDECGADTVTRRVAWNLDKGHRAIRVGDVPVFPEPPKPAMPQEGPPKIERWRFVATGHEFYGIETQNGIVCEFLGQLFVKNHSINELDKLDPEPKESV